MNLTITVPSGSSNHGNPNLLCTPPSWYDYILFYFMNYVAHAATVITTPGQGNSETIFVVLAALLLPGSGITRAIDAIRRHSILESDPLRRAVRAGALCMVVKAGVGNEVGFHSPEFGRVEVRRSREDQIDPEANIITEPKGTDLPIEEGSADGTSTPKRGARKREEKCWWNPESFRLVPDDAIIHGQYHLPKGYSLAFVPLDAAAQLKSPDKAVHKALSSAYNAPKILISLVQTIWAIITLYRARGDQIQQYGYAAFGLTVTPYGFMSVLNIIGSLLNQEYPAIFIVRTPLMEEAESDAEGGFFAAEVPFEPVEDQSRRSCFSLFEDENFDSHILSFLSTLIGTIPLAIIGGLSRFQTHSSTPLQRGFTLSWLVLGIAIGPTLPYIYTYFTAPLILIPSFNNTDELSSSHMILSLSMVPLVSMVLNIFERNYVFIRLGYCLVYGVAAIGGMVVVGQMIREYGVCTLLT
ncbi:hypothetical protein F5Y19DRAFT_419176 [Xylariaceae sp. FL1651]|nr:hypothetical protein F5Y19DRAFT_419176 [Xylariaceae sp. FL1651]